MLSLLSLFFLTGCKDDVEIIKDDETIHKVSGYSEDGLKKSYIYHDFTRKGANPDSCRYRVVYPFTIRIKADGKLVTEEKRYEQYYDDIEKTAYSENNFFIAAASSGVDLDVEIGIINTNGNTPSWLEMWRLNRENILYTSFFTTSRNNELYENDFWILSNPGDVYKTEYCEANIVSKNLTKIHLKKAGIKDEYTSRQYISCYGGLYPYEVYERTPEGEKQIYVDKQTEENWKIGLYFSIYSFAKEITPDNWPTSFHFSHYY